MISGMSPETQAVVAQLNKKLEGIARDLAAVKAGTRTAQLPNSSLEEGQSIALVDAEGKPRGAVGWQPDGGVALVTEGGEPPPAPSTPSVSGRLAGVLVSWDGTMADELPMPSDMAGVQVHISTTSGFTPDEVTRRGSIPRQGGVTVIGPLTAGTTYYVRLVGALTSEGVTGEPSGQASAVPTTVVDGIPEGGIPGTLIEPEGIDTPQLRANAVTATILAAAAVYADALQAGIITGDKLAAIIAIVTRLIAGDESGARVEINGTGFYAYDADENLTVAIDAATGHAVFTGTVTGSTITGSLFQLIDGDTSLELSSPFGTPQLLARTDQDAGSPGVRVGANANVQVAANIDSYSSAAYIDLFAFPDSVGQLLRSPSGAAVDIRANEDSSSIAIRPPDSVLGTGEGTSEGALYGSRRTSGDLPQISMQSPSINLGDEAGRRSATVWEAANDARPYSQVVHFGTNHLLAPGLSSPTTIETTDGTVALTDEMSLLAYKHRYRRTALIAHPANDKAISGGFQAFTSGEWGALTFTTGVSGRVFIIINVNGIYNAASGSAVMGVGFVLSGAGSRAASRKESAVVRAPGANRGGLPEAAEKTIPLTLLSNATYVLTPQLYCSSANVWKTAPATTTVSTTLDDTNGDNSIVVIATP